MKKRVRQNVLGVKQYVPGKPIEEVRREFGLKEVVKLASNENCLGPSPKAIKALKENINLVNRYPDASAFYLRKTLSKYLGLKENRLIFGNGSDEIISMAVRTFVAPGDEVIIARPTFLIYEIVSQLNDAYIKFVSLRDDLKHDLKAMKAAITDRTKMIFIANPDNPTGTYVSKKELDDFFKGLPDKVVIFLDEAYFEFADHAFEDYPNGMEYLSRPNVIVARSFSKAYGLAGLRIGYGISSAEMISYMERVREPFNVNLLAQAAAEAAISDKKFLKSSLSHVHKEKKAFYALFRKMGLKYIESATNFILVDTARDSKEVFMALLKRGIIVRDMKAWGLDTYIRVTIGTRNENRAFMKIFKEILSNL